MSNDVLNFWVNFLSAVGTLLKEEPFIYFFGLFVGTWCLSVILKILRSNSNF